MVCTPFHYYIACHSCRGWQLEDEPCIIDPDTSTVEMHIVSNLFVLQVHLLRCTLVVCVSLIMRVSDQGPIQVQKYATTQMYVNRRFSDTIEIETKNKYTNTSLDGAIRSNKGREAEAQYT